MFVWEWKALGYTIRQNLFFSVYFKHGEWINYKLDIQYSFSDEGSYLNNGNNNNDENNDNDDNVDDNNENNDNNDNKNS